jgi:hypothetical protein
MDTFDRVIEIFTVIAIGISLIEVYLRVNKIWKRKSEKEVAESQSIAGLSIGLFTMVIWLISSIKQGIYLNTIDHIIYTFEIVIFILIGAGIWVKGQERIGFWKLIKKSLKLESKEADYLFKKFFKPSSADAIIKILHQLAMIDDELDPNEQKMIATFAKEWNVEYSPEKLDNEVVTPSENRYIKLKASLNYYLETLPPREQVAQLRDMMNALIQADDKVTGEEELITEELMGMIGKYLNKDEKCCMYHVLIVPQKPEQETTIKTLVPNASRLNVAGGVAYTIGSFYSQKYAEMICNEFRHINFFTIVQIPENGDSFADE